MALTTDRNVITVGMGISYPVQVKASQTIYKGALVVTDSTGYGIPAANAAGNSVAGIADTYIDNSSGSSGDESVACQRGMIARMKMSSAAITDVGKVCYVSDDQTVTTTAGAGTVVGKIVGYVSSSEVDVFIDPAAAPGS